MDMWHVLYKKYSNPSETRFYVQSDVMQKCETLGPITPCRQNIFTSHNHIFSMCVCVRIPSRYFSPLWDLKAGLI